MAIQTAKLNYLRIAPRKVRLIANLVKGLPVGEAEAQLLMHRQRASKPLLKLLRSAIANAKATKKLDPATLVIQNFTVDGGPMLKRFLPRARGMASPIEKKMSHVTLTLATKDDVKPGRFTIVVKKKSKAGAESKKEHRHKHAEEGDEKGGDNKPGFFKRTFNRKAI